MTNIQLDNFNSLLSAWCDHQELRDHGASIADLASSRTRLDDARVRSHRAL